MSEKFDEGILDKLLQDGLKITVNGGVLNTSKGVVDSQNPELEPNISSIIALQTNVIAINAVGRRILPVDLVKDGEGFKPIPYEQEDQPFNHAVALFFVSEAWRFIIEDCAGNLMQQEAALAGTASTYKQGGVLDDYDIAKISLDSEIAEFLNAPKVKQVARRLKNKVS